MEVFKHFVIIFIDKIIPGLMAQFNRIVIYGVLSKFLYDFSFTQFVLSKCVL